MEAYHEQLTKQGFHLGLFCIIESLWLSDDGKSALGRIFLPEIWERDHDYFYNSHPAVLNGAV